MKNIFKRDKNSSVWWVAVWASSLGLAASFLQAIQTINHYKYPSDKLICDINAVFNCNSVFDSWQSSFFGFSNSLMCIVFFAISLGVLLSGATGSQIAKKLRLWTHFFTVFFLGFGAWYLWSSAFVIGALCIYCIFCYIGVIMLNWSWLRINVDDLPVSSDLRKSLRSAIKNNNDTLFWIVWAAIFAGMFIVRFA